MRNLSKKEEYDNLVLKGTGKKTNKNKANRLFSEPAAADMRYAFIPIGKAVKNLTMGILLFSFFIVFLLGGPLWAAEHPQKREMRSFLARLEGRCAEYGWTDLRPGEVGWEFHRTSYAGQPLIFARFGDPKAPMTLLLGGVHGDELPTVYIMLRLSQTLKNNPALSQGRYIVGDLRGNGTAYLHPHP